MMSPLSAKDAGYALRAFFSALSPYKTVALGIGLTALFAPLPSQAAQAGSVGQTLIAATGHATLPSTTPAMLGDQITLAPHQATYKMKLARVSSSAGIVGAGGTIRYAFNDSCDGWTVETHTELTMLQTQGGPVRTAWDLLSWESKDGKSYRFHVRNMRNGEVVEAYEGEAELNDDHSGTATFRLPEQETLTFDLPPNTLFPVNHTFALLRQASRGKAFLSEPVFDGSAVTGAFQVSAVLGKAKLPPDTVASDPSASAPVIDRSLLLAPSWPTTLAFFDLSEQGETPIFEVHLDYYANGATDSLLQDFGDFSLEGKLNSLKALPKPNC